MSSMPPTSFLRLVANDLLKRFGTNLAELTVVFPSRRARLFFNQHLYEDLCRQRNPMICLFNAII